MALDMGEQLTKYLTDAHAIEEMSLQQLRPAPKVAKEPGLARALEEHIPETEDQERKLVRLLEARGASPSTLKEAVLRTVGTGFVIFAQGEPDTSGKLATHALSYEALEWASYDLLARTADRAGEPEVAATARSIRDQERAMMDRLEGLFDRTAEASLREVGDDDLDDVLNAYLSDAHAIENQSIQLLESGRKMVSAHPKLAALFDAHLEESKRQEKMLETRLTSRGGSRSLLKDAAMRIGAFSWGTFFLGHPDTAGKLAAFSYAFEHLEIGGYEQLKRVAAHAEDTETVDVVDRILGQERAAAEKLAGAFDYAVDAALEEQD